VVEGVTLKQGYLLLKIPISLLYKAKKNALGAWDGDFEKKRPGASKSLITRNKIQDHKLCFYKVSVEAFNLLIQKVMMLKF
jgi:hypothetical protein